MNRIEAQGLTYYQFARWPSLKHGIFTRKGGYSQGPWGTLNTGGTVGDDAKTVFKNHTRMYEALHVNAQKTCTVWQIHGADTVLVSGPVRGRRWIALADGMVTDQPDTPLVMRFADCTPVMFYDARQGVIGMAHAGWRGTVAGAGISTLRTMQQAYGCKLADIHAGIGPAIGPERYQVGEEVVAAVQKYFGTLDGRMPEGPLIKRDPADGTAYFNLWAANRLDLERNGLESEQIEVASICTATNTDEFYSHRAEQGRTGRFGVVMSL